MFRYRHTEKAAKHGQFPKKCPLCHLDNQALNPKPRKIVEETPFAIVLEALYPYDLWEFRQVTEHLMIIPKRHANSMHTLTPEERIDFMNLLCKYEARRYNVYSRVTSNIKRTIPGHLHTHLIKTDDKEAKAVLFITKPYLLHKI